MCGLVGMAGDLSLKHRAAFAMMLFFNTLRGDDSTGVSVWSRYTNTVSTRKNTLPGYDFVRQHDFSNFLGAPLGCWLGHGRARTIGAVNRLNAHPFEVYNDDDEITLFGAHNGTLKNAYELERILDKKFGTDSEALLNLIDRDGIKDALAQATGAWALSYWKDGCINLVRNEERPLCYAMTEDGRVLIWASESWMIRIACMREGVELQKDKKGDTLVWSLPTDTLFTWRVPDKGATEFEEPKREGGLIGKPEEKFRFQGYGNNFFEELDKKEKEKKGEAPKGNASDVLVGYEGMEISQELFNLLWSTGCAFCDKAMPWKDRYAWLDEESLCCSACLTGEHIYVGENTGKIFNKTEIAQAKVANGKKEA
jgi:predicted glutamine amidotransferase